MENGEIKQAAKWKYDVRKFKSVNEILDFAISREIEAETFFMELAEMAENPRITKTFKDLAAEEVEHKEKLEAVKAGKKEIGDREVGTLEIVDYVKDVKPHSKMNYIDLLIVGMKKEETSRRLYLNLAVIAQEQGLKDIFLKLAQEEAKHKLRFELDYDLMKFGTP